MGLPTISVEFKKLAVTATTRSSRGVLAVILQDTTGTWASKPYTTLDQVDQADFTPANYAALSRAFAAGPYEVIAVRIGADGTMADAKAVLDTLTYNWVCAVPTGLQAELEHLP